MVSLYFVVFAAVVAKTVKTLPSVDRSTWKPVSLAALSFQLRVTCPFFSTLAARFEGATGTIRATVAMFEYGELPPELRADTR